ncbi:DUF302 domain-containing protein [Neptuniibacter sp. 2_MG-2023]|uniref:DUF302 domain-containing protein n=1 Tax=Neptuniibacter sp. 2_MG-2023 TaxID=3062671 RepID=UPI0026E47A54|nr:DUF302 domain-containing protein [Neptuniibacter sp. 2_MG-2023]MDO6513714.1 DUF302 domain-containing protein [Neptuniibacter sp. 2_MG-2023]
MNRLARKVILICFAFTITTLSPMSIASPVFKLEMEGDFEGNYDKISQSLDANKFFVIFEPNIGSSLNHFKERWGDQYNQNGYEEIQSLVFCNPWYVNQILNKDPEMAALCPLSVTLLHKNSKTTVLFLRPSQQKPSSPAQALLIELENDIVNAFEQAQSAE